MQDGKCVLGGLSDPNCQKVVDTKCVACFQGYYFDSGNQICRQANPLCKTSNSTGQCTSCYTGYEVARGTCLINAAKDVNCLTYDPSNNYYCIGCYPGYVALSGKCNVQNPLCATVNFSNGDCLTCWPGYSLSGGDCLLGTVSSPSYDVYCIRTQGSTCLECARGYYLNQNQARCLSLDPNCKTSNMTTGQCLTCYDGSVQQLGRCVAATVQLVANCAKGSASGECVGCLDG